MVKSTLCDWRLRYLALGGSWLMEGENLCQKLRLFINFKLTLRLYLINAYCRSVYWMLRLLNFSYYVIHKKYDVVLVGNLLECLH